MRKHVIAAGLLCLFLCGRAFSQSSNATVSGTVTDATGAVLPGVTVTANNSATAASGSRAAMENLLTFLSGSLSNITQYRFINSNKLDTWNDPDRSFFRILFPDDEVTLAGTLSITRGHGAPTWRSARPSASVNPEACSSAWMHRISSTIRRRAFPVSLAALPEAPISTSTIRRLSATFPQRPLPCRKRRTGVSSSSRSGWISEVEP